MDIFNEDTLRQEPVASVTGEVQLPGTFSLNPGMKLSDLVYMAGGLKDDADFSKIQIDRTEIVDDSKTRFVRLFGNLHKSVGNPINDPLLMKNDQVYITVATGWHPPWTVMVSGEVMRPGTYPLHRDERLSSLLLKLRRLYLRGVPQGHRLRSPKRAGSGAAAAQPERPATDAGGGRVRHVDPGVGQTGRRRPCDDGKPAKPPAAGTDAASHRPPGGARGQLDALVGSPDDVMVQNGDSITIPQVPASVSVLGSVNEPSSIAAQPGWTVRDYLYRAGGPTPYADTDMIMVVKADGSVITQGGLKAAHPFPFSTVVTGGLMGLHLQAGDTVYVPADVNTFIKTQYALSISTIVANSAESLGVFALVAKTL